MNDIGPGDFVECVDDSPALGLPSYLTKGQVYQIAFLRTVHNLPGCGLVGEGLRNYYRLDRFRPIYRPKAELIQGLLKKDKQNA